MIAGERVTAGLPALTPGLRHAITKARMGRFESDQRLKDHIARESETTSPDGEIDTTSYAQQLGRPFSAAELQRRLKWCNPNLVFEVSLSDVTKTGIYILENQDGKTERRFVCGMMSGVSPERSIRVPKSKKIPNPDNEGEWVNVDVISEEIRGWRTVLARLLVSKLITQAQIDRNFPPHDGVSCNWQKLTT